MGQWNYRAQRCPGNERGWLKRFPFFVLCCEKHELPTGGHSYLVGGTRLTVETETTQNQKERGAYPKPGHAVLAGFTDGTLPRAAKLVDDS